jgi:ribonuclease-3
MNNRKNDPEELLNPTELCAGGLVAETHSTARDHQPNLSGGPASSEASAASVPPTVPSGAVEETNANKTATNAAASETAASETAANGMAGKAPAALDDNASLDDVTIDRLRRCMARTGIEFRNLETLRLALTHASSASNSLDSNERLEFLGDSLLGFIASHLLFNEYRDKQEGDLTRMKALMVSSKWCSRFCLELGLREYMQLGKGIVHDGVSEKVLGNLFEAFVGAVLADRGYDVARGLLHRLLTKFLPEIAAEADWDNPKSDLQHIAQRDFNASPVYDIVASSGPDHQKIFEIRVRINSTVFPAATGSSKRMAEKEAAHNALNVLKQPPRP